MLCFSWLHEVTKLMARKSSSFSLADALRLVGRLLMFICDSNFNGLNFSRYSTNKGCSRRARNTPVAGFGHLGYQGLVVYCPSDRWGLDAMPMIPRVDQLLGIKPCRFHRTVLRAYGLALYGQFDMVVGNLGTHRCVKAVRFAAATCRWTAPAIKKGQVDIVFAGHGGKLHLGFINAPVSHQVTAILGAIAKTKHNGLPVATALQMFFIEWMRVKGFHYIACVFKSFTVSKQCKSQP
jgi:hypothetical protein